jgi:drug/metabolite transporter (DMT)-like permease
MGRVSEAIGRWPAAIQCGFWAILAGTLTTVQLAIVRNIATDVNVFEIVFFRGVFSVMFMSPLLVHGWGTHLRPNRPGLNVLCGSLAFIATVCFYFAARHMPIADITAIHFARPIFAAVAAALILREAIRGSRVLAIIFGVIGAAIIIRPGLVEFNVGIYYVIGVIAVQSWNPIIRKLLSNSEHPDTVAIWNVLTVLPLGLIATVFVWTTPTPEQLAWMGVIGVLEMLKQRVLARAYVRGDAIMVVSLHYTQLPIAAMVGFMMFGEAPDIWIWIGGTVIAVAAVILTRGEMANSRIEGRPR